MTTTSENQENTTETRRAFVFSSVGLAVLSIFSGAIAFSNDFFRTLFHGASQIDLGSLEKFETGRVDLRWSVKHKIFVIKNLDSLYVLSALDASGSALKWSPEEDAFISKSGRRYYKTGIQIEGENKKSLQRYGVKRSLEGHVQVDTTKSFRQEKGEWNDPESFLKV